MKIIFTCGGTGGHIYPAIALYNEFKKNDPENKNQYLFVGSDYGLEKDIFESEQISNYKFISSRGIKRSFSLENFSGLFFNLKAFFQAHKIFKSFKPDFVISTGAYPSFHITYLAIKNNIPFFFN